jgi:membrane protein YqaA with SNARE-associated domain
MLDNLVAAAGHSWGLASLSCLVCGVLSAIFPWIAAEAVLLAFLALAGSPARSLQVVLLIVAGQMIGKAVVFWGARRGRWLARSPNERVERWRAKLVASPNGPASLILVSALVGFPPFFLVTFAAGAWGVEFRQFLVAGTAGRLVRFGAIAWLPHVIPGIGR